MSCQAGSPPSSVLSLSRSHQRSQLTQGLFDGHFPARGRADEYVVLRLGDGLAGGSS